MIKDMNRRDFLKAGSFVVAGSVVFGKLSILNISDALAGTDEIFKPHAFVAIAEDGTVTIWVGQTELGQGIHTGLPMVIADELDADWNTVHVMSALAEDAFKDPLWHMQITGGSSSIRNRWDLLRGVGAAARAMLIEAAARTWGISQARCRTASGKVIHPNGKSISYGKLVKEARRLKVPGNVKPKAPKDYSIMGTERARFDIPDKVSGKAVFGLDIRLDNMLVAVVARPAFFGAKLLSYDEKAAMTVKGVAKVLTFQDRVAVCAETTYAALLGMKKLAVRWSEGVMPDLDDQKISAVLEEHLQAKGKVAQKIGDADAALETAATRLEATYRFPYIAHAALEPINATAHVEKDRCRVWVPTQGQTFAQLTAMKITGLPKEKVEIMTTYVGGGFGLKSLPDPVEDAVTLSKMVGQPVKAMWTREEDFAHDHFRPGSLHSLKGGLDENGHPVAWVQKTACDSVSRHLNPGSVSDGIDGASIQGITDMPYRLENRLVEYALAPLPIPLGYWRSVGYSFTVFTVETFIDEMATAAGKDPVQYRLGLMNKESRAHSALSHLAMVIKEHGSPPAGRFRGFAVTECFESAVAYMAEVSVDRRSGSVTVHKLVGAVDCGSAVYPDQIRAQAQGGSVMAMSVAFGERVEFENGGVKTTNYDNYAVLRMSDISEVVETHIVESSQKAGGVGEPVFPAVAPAIANAVFQATGVRLREMPFKKELLKA